MVPEISVLRETRSEVKFELDLVGFLVDDWIAEIRYEICVRFGNFGRVKGEFGRVGVSRRWSFVGEQTFECGWVGAVEI